MSYVTDGKFEQFKKDAETQSNLFTPTGALRASLRTQSKDKRFMKINIDTLQLAFKKLNEYNQSIQANIESDEQER